MNSEDLILGMDIGGTNFRMGLVDREYRVHALKVVSSKNVSKTENAALSIARTIKDYCRRNLGSKEPKLIAAGFPVVLDRERKRIYSSTNFPGLDGVDIVKIISSELGIPIVIEHDAYYLLAYDIYDHAVKNEGTLLGFYFGTGMGNAMYLDGIPYVGKNGTACEVGHIPTGLSDIPCSCGNRGCIEMHCCGKALERIAAQYFPNTPLKMLFRDHAREPVLEEFVRYMSIPVSAEVNILDPHAVFLGGGLLKMEGFPKEALVQNILKQTRKPYPAANLDIYFSRNAAENGIIGAAIEGFRNLEEHGIRV